MRDGRLICVDCLKTVAFRESGSDGSNVYVRTGLQYDDRGEVVAEDIIPVHKVVQGLLSMFRGKRRILDREQHGGGPELTARSGFDEAALPWSAIQSTRLAISFLRIEPTTSWGCTKYEPLTSTRTVAEAIAGLSWRRDRARLKAGLQLVR